MGQGLDKVLHLKLSFPWDLEHSHLKIFFSHGYIILEMTILFWSRSPCVFPLSAKIPSEREF